MAFLPPQLCVKMYQQLHHLMQEKRYVDEYVAEFNRLVAHVDLAKSDDQLLSKYIGDIK